MRTPLALTALLSSTTLARADEAVLQVGGAPPESGASKLAWKIDGEPLPADRGPLPRVVLTDEEPSRSVHGVRKLEVLDLRSAR